MLKQLNITFFILLFPFVGFSIEVYEDVVWKHFTTEDGLSQNIVTEILQDEKGYLWFSTWNGLSRYDGYNFKSYKIRSGDEIFISNSRIDKMYKDKYGLLWLISYGKNVVQFNPDLEEFQNVLPNEYIESQIIDVKCLDSGVTWVISKSDGAFRIEIDSLTKSVETKVYSKGVGNIHDNNINNVYLDSDNNEWILSNNGLTKLSKNLKQVDYYYINSVGGIDDIAFYSVTESDSILFFSGSNGKVYKYFKSISSFDFINLPFNSHILGMFNLDKSNFLFVSKSGDLFLYNSIIDDIKFIATIFPVGGVNIGYNFYQTKNGDVWIQYEKNKLHHFDSKEHSVTEYFVETLNVDNVVEPNFMIHEDKNDIVWIHPFGGGVYYYEQSDGSLKRFFNKERLKNQFTDQLHSMYSDNQGNLWMSTRSKGLEQFVFPKKEFKVEEVISAPKFINDNDIRVVFEDSRGYLWVSTKSGRLIIYDDNKKQIGHAGSDGAIRESAIFSSSVVYSIMEDRLGYLWISTRGDGLFRAKVDDKYFKIELTHFKHNSLDKYSLSNDNIYQTYEDINGRIWVASFGGGINLIDNDEDGNIKFLNHNNVLSQYPIENCHRVRFITSTTKNELLIGTTHGLVVSSVEFEKYSDLNFKNYTYMPFDTLCLSNNDVHSILESSSGDIYLATFGGGLNKIIRNLKNSDFQFKDYNLEDGLKAEVLLSLLEDNNGSLWMASESGISQFDEYNEQFRHFNKIDFSKIIGFSEGAGVMSNQGKVLFGTNKGVLSFYPDSISKNDYVPPVVFTEFRLFNEMQTPGPNGVLKQHINTTSVINLKHNQNFFSIGFAAIDLRVPESITYYAKLDGFDKNWVVLENQRILNFTNIPVGEYTLRVKSTNSDGVIMDNERTIDIVISPSFWNTSLAYAVYFILFVIVVILSIYIPLYIYKLRHHLVIEKELLDMKLDFFTDISHELRTPLTLILSPLEVLLNDRTLKDEHKTTLKTVERNSSRMLRLINQLLDFVKISNNKLNLTVEKVYVPSLINSVVDNFNFIAVEQNVTLKVVDKSKEGVVWADIDKLEKIFFNLLSNSFKYIGDGDEVKVEIFDDETSLTINIYDNGIGIEEGVNEKLFDRFVNLPNHSDKGVLSTGIGLSIVKELVNIHKGNIYYTSNSEDGTTFSVKLLKGLEHFSVDTKIIENDILKEIEEESIVLNRDINKNEILTDEDNPTLLLVEDNVEVRGFIKSVLQKKFTIYEAGNGFQGLEIAKKHLPDIIVSDLMMPIMSGDEFLEKVRDTIEISHIPFILLTAKTDKNTKIKSVNSGVDDYITKPFSPTYLLSKIESLIEQRRRLQQKFQSTLDEKVIVNLQPEKPEVTSLDQKFLNELKELMEENIDNSSLVVEDLVEKMAVSRSVFFKKLKSLTGLSPIEYIKEVRLNRAVQLLKIGEYNMSQITYMIGFNDPRYFSKCFKEKYNVTPTEYRRSLTNK